MEAEHHHGVSLTAPLMHHDEKQREPKDVEAHNAEQNTVSTTTSFFKTCFNGLNALSDDNHTMCLTLESCHVSLRLGWPIKPLDLWKFIKITVLGFLTLSSFTLQYLSPKMVAKLPDDSSLCVPLILEEKQNGQAHMLEEVESNCHYSSTTAVSFFKTCFNGLNALSGVGILSVPYALASGGWLSLILLFVIAIAAFYSGLLIQRCMDMDSDIRTYPDIGYRAFGNKGRMLVSVVMYVELYLVATGFLILEGDNLHNLLPDAGFEIAGIRIEGKQMFVILVALIILPSVWLDNLSLLSYISASGVLASAIILCSIYWTGAFDGVGFHQKGTPLNWSGIPTAVSLYAFCYCAHPVFPTLYTSMRNKRQFTNVLILCFTLCTVCYASMAVFGYLMFGENVQSQITLNLPTEKLSSKVAIYTTLVNPIAKYALMVTPIVNAAKSWFPCQYNKRLSGLLVSTSLVFSTVAVALVLPFFANLMSLVGAFLSVTGSIILPCLCYLKISGTYRRLECEMVVLWGVILMGFVVGIVGTYTSVMEIIRQL